MATRSSRYSDTPEIVAVDARGHRATSLETRLLPTVAGRFLHTLEAGDRLDHLATKYYRQPRLWWRIADANPSTELASPLALVGAEPTEAWSFPLGTGPAATAPPWHELSSRLREIPGVVEVLPVERPAALVPTVVEHADEDVEILVEHYARALEVRINRRSLGIDDVTEVITEVLAEMIETADLEVGAPEGRGRVGRQIVIPPRTG